MNQQINYRYWNGRHLIMLAILSCICYWCFSLGVLSAKNDNIIQFLPTRFHVSEALRHFHLPLWTPYIYLGYPLHGDMQGGAWNPVVWLLSLFGRYNLTSLQAEILIAIFLSGVGMYRLMGIRQMPSWIKITGAAVYIMSGYITDVGGSNLPFLWAAAYVPFTLAYFYHLFKTPTFNYALKSGLALSLFFVSAYPSFFILAIYIIAAAFITILIKALYRKNNLQIKYLLLYSAVAALVFLCLSLPALISYLQILPHYSRVNGVSLEESFANSFTPACILSFVFPTAATRAVTPTDLITRNAYFNIFLFLLLLVSFFRKQTLFTGFVLTGTLFFFLFSLGNFTPIQPFCYRLFPLMDTFRHPANTRLFVILAGIFMGATVLEEISFKKQFQLYRYSAIAIAIVITVMIFAIISKVSAFPHFKLSTRENLKFFLDSLTETDGLLMNGILQIITIVTLVFFLRPNRFKPIAIATVIIINSFLFSQIAIPLTFCSKLSPKYANHFLGDYPKGFPLVDNLATIQQNSVDMFDHFDTIGFNGFYNKKIATTAHYFTPTFMSMVKLANENKAVNETVLSNPFAYFARQITPLNQKTGTPGELITSDSALLHQSTGANAPFHLKKLWNNGFVFDVDVKDNSIFCLQQVYLPGWSCRIDGNITKLFSANLAFMAVPVLKGHHEVEFIYKPPFVVPAFFLSIFSLILVLVLIVRRRVNEGA